ncbi:MAG: FMN-binding protein [Oscillospiraceae bacterium]
MSELEAANSKKICKSLIDADNFEECENGEITYYAAINGGKTAAYIFTESSKGYGGDVSVMTAIKPDGTVAGVAILDVSGETPGAWAKRRKGKLFSQYIGLKRSFRAKNGAKTENNEVDAVTGATITSTRRDPRGK